MPVNTRGLRTGSDDGGKTGVVNVFSYPPIEPAPIIAFLNSSAEKTLSQVPISENSKIIAVDLVQLVSSFPIVSSLLRIAIERRNPAAGCIHHSDRGVQYACREYVAMLEAAKMTISMSRTANPYDNAHMESFFKTLK